MVLALPMHAAVRQNDIRDCGYAFATCKVYRDADARRMTMIEGFRDRNGKLTSRAASSLTLEMVDAGLRPMSATSARALIPRSQISLR